MVFYFIFKAELVFVFEIEITVIMPQNNDHLFADP